MTGHPEIDRLVSAFDLLLGTEWIRYDADDARASFVVRPELMQPYGSLHGGAVHALVEGICVRGTAAALLGEGKACSSQAIEVSLLRPIPGGKVEARAAARHRGRTSWVWSVDVLDAEDRLCALGKATVAVRPLPPDRK